MAGQISWKHSRGIADFESCRNRISERRFDDHFADVSDVDEFFARRGEFALVVELLGDNASERRMDVGVAQLRGERRDVFFSLSDFRLRCRPIIRIDRGIT